jgi:hypothetical protein
MEGGLREDWDGTRERIAQQVCANRGAVRLQIYRSARSGAVDREDGLSKVAESLKAPIHIVYGDRSASAGEMQAQD